MNCLNKNNSNLIVSKNPNYHNNLKMKDKYFRVSYLKKIQNCQTIHIQGI